NDGAFWPQLLSRQTTISVMLGDAKVRHPKNPAYMMPERWIAVRTEGPSWKLPPPMLALARVSSRAIEAKPAVFAAPRSKSTEAVLPVGRCVRSLLLTNTRSVEPAVAASTQG